MGMVAQAVVIVIAAGAGAFAGMAVERDRAQSQLDQAQVFDAASILHRNHEVALALREGRVEDALSQLEYGLSTTLVFLCNEHQLRPQQLDLYVRDAMNSAAAGVGRDSCIAEAG